MNGRREKNESLRDERVTASLNEPLPGSGLDFEMLLFRRSLEILRTRTITQSIPHTVYFKNLNMAPRLYGQNCKFFTTPLCRNFLMSLEHKKHQTNINMTIKPRSYIRILIYRA